VKWRPNWGKRGKRKEGKRKEEEREKRRKKKKREKRKEGECTGLPLVLEIAPKLAKL
jgi:hypothetical protein